MTMTKKDYELIGNSISSLKGALELREVRIVAETIAGSLASKDANFSYRMFYLNCGVPYETMLEAYPPAE